MTLQKIVGSKPKSLTIFDKSSYSLKSATKINEIDIESRYRQYIPHTSLFSFAFKLENLI